MSALCFIFLILFLFLVAILKKFDIKIYQMVSFIITILIFLFLYYAPIVFIKMFEIACDHYVPQLSGYAYAVWYFIIYICVSIVRFVLLFTVTLYGLYKQKIKWAFLKKYNLIILLITLILDYIIYNFVVQKGISYALSQNNVVFYGLFYSVTIIYLPVLLASLFKNQIGNTKPL